MRDFHELCSHLADILLASVYFRCISIDMIIMKNTTIPRLQRSSQNFSGALLQNLGSDQKRLGDARNCMSPTICNLHAMFGGDQLISSDGKFELYAIYFVTLRNNSSDPCRTSSLVDVFHDVLSVFDIKNELAIYEFNLTFGGRHHHLLHRNAEVIGNIS